MKPGEEARQARQLVLPSTFSFPGRHLLAMFNLVRLFRGRHTVRVLDLGSGPFEPTLIYHVFQKFGSKNTLTTVIGIDSDQRVVRYGQALMAGMAVPLTELAEACTNFEDDGTPRPNTDLNPEGVVFNLSRVERLLGNSPWEHDVSKQILKRIGPLGSDFVIQQDVFELSGFPFDAVVACGLVVNLRKIAGDENIIALLSKIRSAGPKYFCASFTPLDLMRQDSSVDLFTRAGWAALVILADKFVVLNDSNKLLGDFESVFVPIAEAHEHQDFIRETLMVLDDAGLEKEERALGDYRFGELGDTEKIPAAWVRDGEKLLVYKMPLDRMQSFQHYRYSELLVEAFASYLKNTITQSPAP